jgi:hypothetical protein
MAFPVIMMMDIYIDNYIKKYGGSLVEDAFGVKILDVNGNP